MDRFFSVPMVLVALLVLPVLALEYYWPQQLEAHPLLDFAVAAASSLIWFAFAVEFLVMVSVAENKLHYTVSSWLNLFIILLPLVQFLPLLRLLRMGRLLRLEQVTRLGRVYRLRGVFMRAWRAFLLLEVIHLLLGRSLERRLQDLEELLAARLEEVQELRSEIEDLKERLAKKQAVREESRETPTGR